jgi:SAM-dependent methyltransferase
LERVHIESNDRLLEVGVGTGAILSTTLLESKCRGYGLDIDLQVTQFAAYLIPDAAFTTADGVWLPFVSEAFEIVYCHFLLLWIAEPELVLREMIRVTKQGGSVIVFAEPDYGGRIFYPQHMDEIGMLQTNALQQQGADPFIGRELRALLNRTALVDVEIGILGGEWHDAMKEEYWESEWMMLESDLAGTLSPEEIISAKELDRMAWRERKRLVYVPTFYGCGTK